MIPHVLYSQDSFSDERNIQIPEGGKLQYIDQTIYVTFPSQEVLAFEGIRILHIEDKLKGNSVYTNTGVESLCGYGK